MSQYGIYDSIPVIYGSDSITSPWCGGLHSPITSYVDINKDGVKDLVIFDRFDNSINVFIRRQHKGFLKYIHDPFYTQFFPNLDSWVLLYDYNGDSLPDIFTTSTSGITVYKNISKDPTKSLEWHQLLFRSSSDSTKWGIGMSHKRYYNATDYLWSAINCNNLDVPALVDIEGDGDMDIVIMTGTQGRVSWFENISVDQRGKPDTLDFRNSENCWGRFSEDMSNNSILLGSCKGSRSGSRHAAGSTIYLTKIDSGNTMDCFIGGALDPRAKALYNSGSNKSVNMTSMDTNFNSKNVSVNLKYFVRPLSINLNHDTLEDLLFTPANYLFNKDHNQFWNYENIGSPNNPIFSYVDSAFLYDQTMDFGTSSHPLLINVDGDSLTDLLVSNTYYTDGDTYWTNVAYFKNIGDNYVPKFKLITKNYKAFDLGFDGLHLAKGDLDNDGDIDLLGTKSNGVSIWFENKALLPTDSAQFVRRSSTFDSLQFGNYSKPHLVDIDGDSLLDLLVGSVLPFISYYKNIGTKSTPKFDKQPNHPQFGWIHVKYDNPNNYPLLSPHMIEVDSTGKLATDSNGGKRLLLIGVSEGPIYSYEFDTNGTAIPVDTIHTYNKNLTLTVDILNRDSLPVIISGTQRGGLISMVKGRGFVPKPPPLVPVDTTQDTITDPDLVPEFGGQGDIRIYPNPFSNALNIMMNKNESGFITIFDMKGRIEMISYFDQSEVTLNTENLSKGLYILEIKTEDWVSRHRVIHIP